MITSTFFIIPADIIESAITYVQNKTKVTLAEDRLQDLYKRVHDRRVIIKGFVHRNPDVKIATTFYAAKEYVLKQEFPLERPEDLRYRSAYSMAISKVGSEFSKRKKRERTLGLKRSERERIADFVTLDEDRRQYRFILPVR